MSILFRRATRDGVNLLIGLVAPSGGGKTYTALRLATNSSGYSRFFMLIRKVRARRCVRAQRQRPAQEHQNHVYPMWELDHATRILDSPQPSRPRVR